MKKYNPFGGGLWVILVLLYGSGAAFGLKYIQTGFVWQGVFSLILLVAGCAAVMSMYNDK